jgi:ribonucleoside-diphosphate reductase alpha chain
MQWEPAALPARRISITKPSAKKVSLQRDQKAGCGSSFRFRDRFVFNVYTLGEECLKRLGFKPEQYFNFEWSLLEALGFTDEQIEEANDYVCGTMTLKALLS